MSEQNKFWQFFSKTVLYIKINLFIARIFQNRSEQLAKNGFAVGFGADLGGDLEVT